MKPKVYLETTIPSYLTSRPSRDVIVASHQRVTSDWWQLKRTEYELFISQAVLDEASLGDVDAAADRLIVLNAIPLIAQTADVVLPARELATRLMLPKRAHLDAMHISYAALGAMHFLLTWNCTHIANAHLWGIMREVVESHDLSFRRFARRGN